MQKEVMIQIMKLVKYKHLSVNLKTKKMKELEDEIKKSKLQLTNQSAQVVKKCFTKLQRMKNINKTIKIKNNTSKFGKELRTTYCFGCIDFTHNFRLQEVKMTNKVLREKSNCTVCWSNKSRFLKQKHSNKK